MRLPNYARAMALGGLLAANGCSRQDDAQPRAVTSDEQQRLNDAAAMLDNESGSANALTSDNDEEPAQ